MKKDRGNFTRMGGIEVVDVIRHFGAETDYCLGSAIRYFLLAPYRDNEELDYRSALTQLEMIYEREKGAFELLFYSRTQCSPMRIPGNKANFGWLAPLNPREEITLRDVVRAWELHGLRKEFMEAIHYKNFDLEKAIRTVDTLVDLATDYSDSEL